MDDPVFKWTELILDHLWLLFPLLVVGYLLLNPSILRSITSLKIGDFEVQLACIQEELQATKQATHQIAQSQSQIEKLIGGININSSVAELRDASQALKIHASHLDGEELASGLAGLQPGSDATKLHAAAVIARKRRDPLSLPQLIDCIQGLAMAPNLANVRLNSVWQLASAVHLTLVAVYKHGASPAPDRDLLQRAEVVLKQLIAHRKVQNDRPDDPKKGVRGPAENALHWIGIALAKPQG